MTNPKVTILIPNRNGRQLLEKYLCRVLQVKGIAAVIVVDDHSEDGSVDFVRHRYPEITVLEKPGLRRGFASTVNFGLKHVSTDLVALFNTDVVPEPDCIEKSLRYFSDPQLFAVGFLDRSHEKDGIVLRGRGVARWKNGFYRHGRGEVDRPDTAWVSGGSGIFRMSLLEKLDYFDELFDPFYWEDIDLSYRARKAGYKIVFAPECQVDHFHNAGAIKTSFTDKQVRVVAFRNELIFHWKNLTDSKIMRQYAVSLVKFLLVSILTFKYESLLGFTEAILKLPEILVRRRQVRRLFVLSDQELDVE